MSVLTLCCWLALVWSAGWFFLPLSRRIFGEVLPDGGLAVGRVLFLATWTLLAFWLGHAGAPTHLTAWLWLILAAVGITLGVRDKAELKGEVKTRRRAMRMGDGIFLFVFLLFFGLRGFWSDTDGDNGEKAMDSALIGSITRARKLPPPNPYAAGANLRGYYYFGHLETALLTDATATTTRWSYNLMCATLPALCFSVLFSLGAGITGRLLGGAFVSSIVLGLGTLEPIIQWSVRNSSKPFGVSTPLGLDFFATSRVIPFTINEFPWFTFNQADLHAHYFDFPFALATMCLAFAIFRGRLAAFVTAIFVLGVQVMTNTWDFPAYGILLGLSVLCGAPFKTPSAPQPKISPAVGMRFARIAMLFFGALLVAAPYLINLRTAAAPPQKLPQPASPLREWLVLWGPFAAAWLSFSAYTVFRTRWQRAACLGFVAAVLFVAFRSRWFSMPPETYLGSTLVLPLILLLLGLSIWGACTLRNEPQFLCFLAIGGLLALLWSETTWAGFLGNPNDPQFKDSIRQDTVFKFGLQTWMLWGVAATCGIFATMKRWPDALQCVFIAPLPILMISTMAVTFGRTHNFLLWNDQGRWVGPIHLSPSDPFRQDHFMRFWGGWDGWAHLHTSEKDAANWLVNNTPPGENIIEAEQKAGGDYTNYTRYAHATGIPTVIGPQAHSFQWSPANANNIDKEWEEVFRRKNAVRTFYLSPDPLTRRNILEEFHVKYIVFGELERVEYGDGALEILREGYKQVAAFGNMNDPHRVWIFSAG